MSRAERRALVEHEAPALPVSRQCRLLAISRSSVYRRPADISEEDCSIMVLIDRQYPARPHYDSPRMTAWLATPGHVVNRKRVPPDAARRLGGDLPATEHEQGGTGAQDLSLPAGRDLDRAGQSGLVRGRHLHPDGQGLPLPGGDHGLGEPCRAGAAAVEHARLSNTPGCRTRPAVEHARLSNTLGAEFCVEALEKALSRYGRPEIFNTDQSLPRRKPGAASSPATTSPAP